MKKTTIQVFKPVTKELVYSIDVRFNSEISEDIINSEFKINDTTNLREITIRAKNKRIFYKLLTRVSLELAEDAFYCAFPELNRLGLTAQEQIDLETELLQGLEKTDIVSEILDQILASYFDNN